MSIWTDEAGRLHVGVMANGRRIHRRMPEGTSKGSAKLIEADLLRAAGTRQVNIPGDPTLKSVMDLYLDYGKTLRSPSTAKYHAIRGGKWYEGKHASDAEHVAAKMIKDMTGKYAPATINKTLGTLKKALTIAYMSGMTAFDFGDKIKRLPENNQRHTYLSVDEVKKLADCCSEQVRAAVWIALLTGCRRGEICKLQQSDIKENRIRILQGNTKSLKERLCPIVPALRPWLQYIPLKINFEGVKSGFRRGREKAGIDVNFHDLRHSCASLLINMGVPLEVIRDILGHSTVKTTERYAHLQIDRQEEAMNRLSDLITPRITPGKKKGKPKPLEAA
jgi:integrase